MAHNVKHKKLMKGIGKPKAKKLFKALGKYMKTARKGSKMKKSAAYKAKNRGKQGYREDQQKHDMGHTRTGKYYLKQGRKIRMSKALAKSKARSLSAKDISKIIGYKRRKPSSGGIRTPSSGGAYREIIGMISKGGGG